MNRDEVIKRKAAIVASVESAHAKFLRVRKTAKIATIALWDECPHEYGTQM